MGPWGPDSCNGLSAAITLQGASVEAWLFPRCQYLAVLYGRCNVLERNRFKRRMCWPSQGNVKVRISAGRVAITRVNSLILASGSSGESGEERGGESGEPFSDRLAANGVLRA